MTGERWACVCVCQREREREWERGERNTARKMTKKKEDLKTHPVGYNKCSSACYGTKIRRWTKIIASCTDQIWSEGVAESAECQRLLMLDTRYGWAALYYYFFYKSGISKTFKHMYVEKNKHNIVTVAGSRGHKPLPSFPFLSASIFLSPKRNESSKRCGYEDNHSELTVVQL